MRLAPGWLQPSGVDRLFTGSCTGCYTHPTGRDGDSATGCYGYTHPIPAYTAHASVLPYQYTDANQYTPPDSYTHGYTFSDANANA